VVATQDQRIELTFGLFSALAYSAVEASGCADYSTQGDQIGNRIDQLDGQIASIPKKGRVYF
jgi:hypothetical protein